MSTVTVLVNGTPAPAKTLPYKARTWHSFPQIWRCDWQPTPTLTHWPAKHKRVGRLWRRAWQTVIEQAAPLGSEVVLMYEVAF
jgi:hypothetical protein